MSTEIFNIVNQLGQGKLTAEQAADLMVEKVNALAKENKQTKYKKKKSILTSFLYVICLELSKVYEIHVNPKDERIRQFLKLDKK